MESSPYGSILAYLDDVADNLNSDNGCHTLESRSRQSFDKVHKPCNLGSSCLQRRLSHLHSPQVMGSQANQKLENEKDLDLSSDGTPELSGGSRGKAKLSTVRNVLEDSSEGLSSQECSGNNQCLPSHHHASKHTPPTRARFRPQPGANDSDSVSAVAQNVGRGKTLDGHDNKITVDIRKKRCSNLGVRLLDNEGTPSPLATPLASDRGCCWVWDLCDTDNSTEVENVGRVQTSDFSKPILLAHSRTWHASKASIRDTMAPIIKAGSKGIETRLLGLGDHPSCQENKVGRPTTPLAQCVHVHHEDLEHIQSTVHNMREDLKRRRSEVGHCCVVGHKPESTDFPRQSDISRR